MTIGMLRSSMRFTRKCPLRKSRKRFVSNRPDFGICNSVNSENSRPVKSVFISSAEYPSA